MALLIIPAIITPFEWIIIIFLAAVIAAAVAYIINAVWGSDSGSGSSATQAGRAASEKMVAKIAALAAERREPTADECAQLRAWHNAAQSGGVSNDVVGPALQAINKLCPGS